MKVNSSSLEVVSEVKMMDALPMGFLVSFFLDTVDISNRMLVMLHKDFWIFLCLSKNFAVHSGQNDTFVKICSDEKEEYGSLY